MPPSRDDEYEPQALFEQPTEINYGSIQKTLQPYDE